MKPFQPRVLLEVEELSLGKAYRDVSFKLRAGEILGIAGVIGSGREELTRTLAGFAPHDGGRLMIADREARLTTPAEAVDLSIGYVPRERRVEGRRHRSRITVSERYCHHLQPRGEDICVAAGRLSARCDRRGHHRRTLHGP